jgi:hypothetical protein
MARSKPTGTFSQFQYQNAHAFAPCHVSKLVHKDGGSDAAAGPDWPELALDEVSHGSVGVAVHRTQVAAAWKLRAERQQSQPAPEHPFSLAVNSSQAPPAPAITLITSVPAASTASPELTPSVTGFQLCWAPTSGHCGCTLVCGFFDVASPDTCSPLQSVLYRRVATGAKQMVVNVVVCEPPSAVRGHRVLTCLGQCFRRLRMWSVGIYPSLII